MNFAFASLLGQSEHKIIRHKNNTGTNCNSNKMNGLAGRSKQISSRGSCECQPQTRWL